MTLFSKESLEKLRQSIHLIEVLAPYIELKKNGASYKGLCPFHDEKTPSFIVQQGGTHYHCFGCGAHGDAIQFLMNHQKHSFLEAVEHLADRFHIPLEKIENKGEESKTTPKKTLKELLTYSAQFFHFYLLYTQEGQAALHYLKQRGIDEKFILQFQLGLAPKYTGILAKALHIKGWSKELVVAAGLSKQRQDGKMQDFFIDRLMFPVYHHTNEVIGFSARKYNEDTFGGKYINSPETVLFKKSRILFGFNFARKSIIKERKVIIVEGQLDALRLIYSGFNTTVAGMGTAFGEEHVKELLQVGVQQVFLAFDSDDAGLEASVKVGHFFQKQGVEVKVVLLPEKEDPDSFIRNKGAAAFSHLLEESMDYLSFLLQQLSKQYPVLSAAAKNEIAQQAMQRIREWNHPIMVYETLRKLAHMMQVPEELIGISPSDVTPHVYTRKSAYLSKEKIDPDYILETDLLRWLLIANKNAERFFTLVQANLTKEDFRISICQDIFSIYCKRAVEQQSCDLLSLVIELEDADGLQTVSHLIEKKIINLEKAEAQLVETIQKILDRNWMEKREKIKMAIQNEAHQDEEVLHLMKQFNELKRPQVHF